MSRPELYVGGNMGFRVLRNILVITLLTLIFPTPAEATTLCQDSADLIDIEDVIEEAKVCTDTASGCEAFSCLDACIKTERVDPLECAMLCTYSAKMEDRQFEVSEILLP